MTTPLDLPEITADPPSGPNLELDPAFGEMERAAQGKAESQFGNTIEAVTPPDWQEAAAQATALLARTRDLRIMVMLGIARLNLHDFPGFASALATIRAHIETMWDRVHPQLDPEDDNDPLLRANALLLLAHPGRVLRPLRDLPLATPPRARPVSWRDIAILNGALEAEPGRERISEAAIRGAFAATDAGKLAVLRDAVAGAQTDLVEIASAFDAQTGPGMAPDFTELSKLVRELGRELTRYEAVSAEMPGEMSAEESTEPDAAPGAPVRAAGRFASVQAIAALNSRDEALHALDLAAAYFRGSEPSSPLPLLIDRARKLAAMSFLEILRDLAPDGLSQAQVVTGTPESFG